MNQEHETEEDIGRLRFVDHLTYEEIGQRIGGFSPERVRQLLLREYTDPSPVLDAEKSAEFKKFKDHVEDGGKWWEAEWLAHSTRCRYAQELGLIPHGYCPGVEKARLMDEITRLHGQGRSSAEIARKLEISSTEFNRLRRELRKTGIDIPSRRAESTARNLKLVRELAPRMTLAEVAEETGLSPMTLTRYRRQYGVRFAEEKRSVSSGGSGKGQGSSGRSFVLSSNTASLRRLEEGTTPADTGRFLLTCRNQRRMKPMGMDAKPPDESAVLEAKAREGDKNDALLQVYLPSALKERLKRIARERGTNLSDMLRTHLEKFVEESH